MRFRWVFLGSLIACSGDDDTDTAAETGNATTTMPGTSSPTGEDTVVAEVGPEDGDDGSEATSGVDCSGRGGACDVMPCCDGLFCAEDGTCSDVADCAGDNESCIDADCCADLFCMGGVCRSDLLQCASRPGASCIGMDCCPGLLCAAGVCEDDPSCQGFREPCTDAACCDGLLCQGDPPICLYREGG